MRGKSKLMGVLAALTALAMPGAANATYNANTSGVIVSIRVYDTGLVMFTLQVQPASHPYCGTQFFAIDSTVDPDIRAMLLSRALVAKSSGETVNIGYDGLTSSCANGYMRVHEIGS